MVFEIIRLDDVHGVDGCDRKLFLGSVASTVVRVPVLDDLAKNMRQVVHQTWNLDSEEVLVPPRANSGLPLQDLEHSALAAGRVSGDGHPTLFAHRREDSLEGHRREIRRRVRIGDAKRAEVTSELVLIGIRRVDTKDMHALARRQLEAGKDMQAPLCGSLKCRHATNAVVIGNGEDRYSELKGLVDDGPHMRGGIARGGLPLERAAVVMRSHLERAAVEHGAGGKRAGTKRVVVRVCQWLLL